MRLTFRRAVLLPALTLAAVSFAGGCNSSQSKQSGRSDAGGSSGGSNAPLTSPPVDQPSVAAEMAKPTRTMPQTAPTTIQPSAPPAGSPRGTGSPQGTGYQQTDGAQPAQAKVQEAKKMEQHGEQFKQQGDEVTGTRLIEQAKVKEAEGKTQIEQPNQPTTRPQ